MFDALSRNVDRAVDAVVAEVPGFDGAGVEPWRTVMRAAADQLIGALLTAFGEQRPGDAPALEEVLDGTHAFGRREARQGRPVEVQLAAYRVSARTIWRESASLAIEHDTSKTDLAAFAEMFFTYLDQISATAAAGHARSGVVRQRRREFLVRQIVAGAPAERLLQAAEAADWTRRAR